MTIPVKSKFSYEDYAVIAERCSAIRLPIQGVKYTEELGMPDMLEITFEIAPEWFQRPDLDATDSERFATALRVGFRPCQDEAHKTLTVSFSGAIVQ